MTIEEMTDLMRQRRLHHLLVCNRAGELLGVVSDRDLHPQHGVSAQQLMSFPVLTATPDTPLNPAITFLVNENISCLPVVENGRLCGVLTTTDLVLTLQCTLQLWLRLAQVLQYDSGWAKELEQLTKSLEGDLSQTQLAERMQKVRGAIRQQVQDLINLIDLRADVLTGVSNRSGLEEVLEMLLAVRHRYEQPFSLVLVVIDHYQQIGDRCGDAVIKSLMKALARTIQQSIRGSDFVARCRDDAFAVVLTQTELEGATIFCHRLCEAAKQNSQVAIPLRIRTGVVMPEPDETAAALLHRAEDAAI
jgi:diguanylate cyclase (GGDEF)-like protein